MGAGKKEIYYVPFYTKSRDYIVRQCVDVLERGNKFIYILPSREAMFDVRNKVTDIYGGLINPYIFGMDDLERAIVGDGIPASKLIDGQASIIILNSLCGRLQSEGKLRLFGGVADKSGFVEAAYRVIKRLKRLNLAPRDFMENTSKMGKALADKCRDIYEIYGAYEQYKKEKGIHDIDDISRKAVDMAASSAVFEDVELFVVDGYINIDPVNKALMKSITETHPGIRFILNVPYKNRQVDGFVSKEVLKDFEDLGFTRIEISSLDMVSADKSLESAAQNLFSRESGVIGDTDAIRVLNAPCIENEVRQAARIIKRRLTAGEAAPGDIAIYVNDMEQYEDNITSVFGEMGIPVNIPSKQALITQPVIRDILAALRLRQDVDNEETIKTVLASKYLADFDVLEKTGFRTERLLRVIDEINCSAGVVELLETLERQMQGAEAGGQAGEYGFGPEDVTASKEAVGRIGAFVAAMPERDHVIHCLMPRPCSIPNTAMRSRY